VTAPVLQQTSPADDTTGVAVGSNLVLTYDQTVQAGAGVIQIRRVSDESLVKSIDITDASQISFSGSQVTVNPTTDLPGSTAFYVVMSGGAVRNLASENAASISTATAFNFTTAAGPAVDTTAPVLTGTTPTDNATGVAVGSNLVLTYNEAVQAGSGVIQIRRVSDEGLVKSIDITDASQITFSGNQVTINPTTDLPASTAFYVVMTGGAVRDLASNNAASISSATQFNFTMAGGAPPDTTAPVRTGTTPNDNATGVAVGSNLVLTYNEAVQAGSGVIQIRKVSDESLVTSIDVTDASQVSFSGNQVTVNPTSNLPANTALYVVMTGGAVRDLAGNSAAGISTATAFNFTTGNAPADGTAPTLQSTTPADDAINVLPSTNIVLNFDESVKAGSGNIEIRKVSGDTLVKSISVTDGTQVNFSGSQVTINPTTNLDPDTAYYVKLPSGVILDLANNPFAGITSSTQLNFTTRETTPPHLTDISPDIFQHGVSVGSNLTLTFDEAVKAGSGFIEIHYLDGIGSIAQSISVTDTSQVTFSGNQVTINPSSDLLPAQTYYVTMSSGVIRDLANNSYAGISTPYVFNFTMTDPTLPELVGVSPYDNSTDIDPGTDLFLYFDEGVKAGSGNIEIRNASDNSLVKSISITDAGQVTISGSEVLINPSSDIPGGYTYYVTFGSGVILDMENNAFAGISSPTAFNFSVPNIIVGTPDADALLGGAGNDTINGQIGVDTLTGGAGDDTYIIGNYEGGETALHIYSEPDDPVGDGRSWSFLPQQIWPGDFLNSSVGDATGDGIVDIVFFHYTGDGVWWDLSFSTADHGVNFAPGTYEGGLSIYSSQSAGPIFGEFTVHEADFQYAQGWATIPLSLSISFEQHVYSIDGPALFGIVNYKYSAASAVTVDQVVENPGGGTDTVLAAISYTLAANVENLTLTDYADIDGTGNSLNNVITGNTGDNVLDGAAGADTMAAGLGDDTYVVDNVLDTITELPGEGTETVQSSITLTLGANLENLTLTGSGNINGTGNGLANILTGNAGTNVLTGGAGDDTYVIGTGDSVVESADAGADTVQSSVTHTLASNVENLSLTGSANINGTGNGLNNTITGTYQTTPGTGQNVLTGGSGNDTLDGDTGLDTLIGGVGDDTYIINNYENGQTSLVIRGPEDDWLTDGQTFSVSGNVITSAYDVTHDGIVDQVYLGYSDSLHSWNLNFSTAQLGTNLVPGTYLDARRYSEAIPGKPGMEIHGDGNSPTEVYGSFTVTEAVFDYSGDTPVIVSLSISFEQHADDPLAAPLFGTVNYNYSVAGPAVFDTITENSGEGTDTVRASVSYVLPTNVENLVLTGYGDLNGTGNAANNSLTGNEYDNILDGMAGADTMAGDVGNDTYIVDNVGDEIIEENVYGHDTVQSSVTHTLDANVEDLVLTGSANINGGGNDLDNVLTGNSGNNVLSGGLGDDRYIIGAGDSVTEGLDAGNDTVESSATHALDANVENLILTGTGNINGTGNGLDNVLTGTNKLPGTGGQNVLTGGGGNDTLNGGTGLDTLIGGFGDDTYVLDSYEGGATSILLQIDPGYPGVWAETVFLTEGSFTAGLWDITNDGLADRVSFFFNDASHWDFEFGTDQLGQNLAPGTYLDAERAPLPGHPGFSISSGGQGTDRGSFTITNVVVDYSGPTPVLVSFSATFETENSYTDEPAYLYGVLNYNYAPAGPLVPDTIVENAGEGTDTVQAAGNYVLGANLENLTLTYGHTSGTGNSLNNVITGSWGNNLLNGAGGADTLIGEWGDDTFKIVAGAGSDVITDFNYGGNDTVILDGFALGTFGAVQAAMTQNGANTVLNLGNGETLTFLNFAKASFGASDFSFLNAQAPSAPPPFTLPVSGAFTNTINGTRQVDNLTGSAANNKIDGKQLADTMSGGLGDDTYVVDVSGDIVVESSGQGIDTVISSAASYTLANNVENLTLTGTTNHTAIGNGLDNLIIASARPDIIDGGAGNDILRAGTGACVLTGGAGNDIFDFDVMGSQKQITDFTVGQDLVDLRTLLTWYGGSNPVTDNAISLSAVAGGVLVSIKASAGGSLQGLVKITGVAVGDLDVGGDILWDT
jgi:Ca2+-binding RTX toxin-like protein/methionine-rich copper-binding protein CopC